MLNEDYKEILQNLLRNKTKFLVVGAYAMAMYGYPRATGDFDIWVEASEENSEKCYKSLLQFGAPAKDIVRDTFAKEDIIFQIGIAPRRIDVITSITGVQFKEAYKNRQIVKIEGLDIPFLSLKDLIKNKGATGRDKDKIDVKNLKKLK